MALPVPKASLSVQPNVTPMIDVMLVLLIVFMVVAPALAAGIPAVPPQAAHLRAHPEDPSDATIGIDRLGGLYLNKHRSDSTQVAAALRARFTTHPDDRVVYLRADRQVDYRVVQATMDLAARSGASVVGLIAEQPTKVQPR